MTQKSRRVFVTLELQTARSLAELRSSVYWWKRLGLTVLQAQANVSRSKEPKEKRCKPKR